MPSRSAAQRHLLRIATSVLFAMLAAGGVRATAWYVDPAGVDDDTVADGSAAQPWRTIAYALRHATSGAADEVHVAAGEYSLATGEVFPLVVPLNVSLLGAGPGLTVVRDTRTLDNATVQWRIRAGEVPVATAIISGLSIVRESTSGPTAGTGLRLLAEDAAASPVLTNLLITGAARGVLIDALSQDADTTLNPVIRGVVMQGNAIGLLASSYTALGFSTHVDPQITNCVASGNVGDGMVFETAADSTLPSGARFGAVSNPVITHCTMARNVGSGILLDNSNGDVFTRAGQIQPVITNCILASNGDYGLHEYTTSVDPSTFDGNQLGGNGLGLYRDEGTTDLLTLTGVPGRGNVATVPVFVRAVGPDWHLRADSPGVDSAFSSTTLDDIDGQARPLDSNGDGTPIAEIGSDEVNACAVTAAIDPPQPADRCGTEGPLTLSAAGSLPTTGFGCSGPLAYAWYADGVLVGTGVDYTETPTQTTTYAIVVTCPDFPDCQDTASARVVVHPLPTARADLAANAGPDYGACVAWDAPDVTIALRGDAQATDPQATIDTTRWSSPVGVLTGGSALNPLLTIPNTGANQDVTVTLTATDSNGCRGSATAVVHVWRGPRASAGGAVSFCQVPGPQTAIPLSGSADVPAGSTVASWSWRTTVGSFDDARAQSPRLTLSNLPFARVAMVTLTVTDDKGCSSSDTATVTLEPTDRANPGGPYQLQEAAVSPTSFAIMGSSQPAGASTFTWTTTLGTFTSSGTTTASGASQTLDVPNIGADQSGQVCLTVGLPNGCTNTACTSVAVRTSAPQRPNDVGGTFHVDKVAGVASLSWTNAPIDATHDLATFYDIWESGALRPVQGTWAPRAGLVDIPSGAGLTTVTDPGLLDLAGADLIFMKVVSKNPVGFSCPDPAAELPRCPACTDPACP